MKGLRGADASTPLLSTHSLRGPTSASPCGPYFRCRVQSSELRVKIKDDESAGMTDRDLTVPKRDELAEWDGASVTHEVGPGRSGSGGGGLVGWMGARVDAMLARLIDGFARRPPAPGGSEPVALARTGG